MKSLISSRLGLFALLAAVALLYLGPMVMTVYGAFRTAPPGLAGSFSLAALRAAFSDPVTYSALGNSLLLAVCAGLSATALAVAFAWIVSRTTAALRRMVTPLMAVVLATPPLFFALAWNLLGTPRFGLINEALAAVGLPDSLSVSGAWGSWFVLSLKLTSLGYLVLIGPFLAMDRRLEEASLVAGAGRLRTFRSITVPVMAPAVLSVFIIGFVVGLIVLDIPLIIGRPSGLRVFATQIFDFANNEIPPNYAGASALAMVFIVVVTVMVAIKWRLLDRRHFTTVGGKGTRPEAWDIGRLTWLCNAAVVGYALLALVLPTVQIVLGSLQPVFGLNVFSLDNYRALLDDPQVLPALLNTVQYALVGGALAVALVLVLAMVSRHGSTGLRRTLELVTWLPWALQGIILGLALVWTFLSVPFLRGLFGTAALVLIGLVVASTPVAGRAVDAALAQLGRELEESARVSGAGPVRTTVGIVVRLLLPSCLAAWLITAIQIAGNFEVPVLLSNPANQPTAVLVYQLYVQGQVTHAAALFVLVLGSAVALATVLGAAALVVRRVRRPAPHPSPAPEAPRLVTQGAQQPWPQSPSGA